MTIVSEKQEMARREEALPSPATGDLAELESQAPLVADGFVLPELDVPEDAPPAYGEHRDRLQFNQPGFEAGATVTEDGRINININTKNRRLAELLAPVLDRQASLASEQPPPPYIPPGLGEGPDHTKPPPLNIVIQIVGSRGDVQPFVALGKTLKETYGHRIRIATHPNFKEFVEENDLEFFSIGGDPAELMAFMVKYPGLMPGMDALTSGEVSKRRKGIEEILIGCWRSCIETGDGFGPPPKSHNPNELLDFARDIPIPTDHKPFVADAIIANPPSFAHIHVAEKLGIPLHIMFTMPWSPTRAFPHPLANIQSSNADDVVTNNLTYTLVEMMTWQGLGDIINRFREKILDLSALSLIWAPGLLNRMKVPHTYCWSPALIPKPQDWGGNIDVSGFYFLNLASSFTPEPELAAFLEAGPPPVYIGFGSIVVDDPNAMTRMIFDAIHLSGIRALVSKGWGGIGADDIGIPEGVFMLGNVPHDWLFEKVSAVVHHGGAGTTAAGIKAGKPTFVVPFFGDQPFWGAMIARANAGPDPIKYKDLTAEKLAEAIKFCLKPDTVEQARIYGEKIREETGTDMGGASFHRHLDLNSLRCSMLPKRVAAWRVRRSQVKLSTAAATFLVKKGLLKYSDLKLYRSFEHNTEDQPLEPISAAASSLVMDLSGMGMAIADMPRNMWKSRKGRKDTQSSKGEQSETVSTSQAPTSPEAASILSSSQVDISQTDLTEQNTSNQSLADESMPSPSLEQPASSATPPDQASERGSASQSESKNLQHTDSTTSMNMETAIAASKGVEKFITTGVKSPMNFCLGLARGFRNMPRLYNDDTVRPVEKVTNVSSGLKVAGKELGYGFFDGISGLVTQPLRGAEKDGAAGLIKGFGKGIGGLIAKPAAGIWALPAYTMQGVHAELHKMLSRSVQNYVITSRVQQGQMDQTTLSTQEQDEIIKGWDRVQFDLSSFQQFKRKEKGKGKSAEDVSGVEAAKKQQEAGFAKPRTGWLHTRNMTYEQRKQLHADKEAWKQGYVQAPVDGKGKSQQDTGDPELEQAIQASVQETSRGNAEEDAAVELAIRQSINAMQESGTAVPGTDSRLAEKDASIFEDQDYQITDEEYQNLVQQAMQQSLADTRGDYLRMANQGDEKSTGVEPPSYGTQPGGSADAPNLPPRAVDPHEEEFERAIAASKEEMEKAKSQQDEEDMVLEYIKKQSLAEEEYRKKLGKGKESGEENDEELRKAMEESLKLSGGNPDSGPSWA